MKTLEDKTRDNKGLEESGKDHGRDRKTLKETRSSW